MGVVFVFGFVIVLGMVSAPPVSRTDSQPNRSGNYQETASVIAEVTTEVTRDRKEVSEEKVPFNVKMKMVAERYSEMKRQEEAERISESSALHTDSQEISEEGKKILKEIDESFEDMYRVARMVQAAERGKEGKINKVLDTWWDMACKEFMRTREYFSEKEVFEVMLIFADSSCKRLSYSYKDRHVSPSQRDTYAEYYWTASDARDIVKAEYALRSEEPGFDKITYYTKIYKTGLLR